ncbi:MAG TPA: carbonic anhydrase [Acidimicrobiales bacterium]|nr:carbonic anhydrase [Acidimicrobiales bacterium]
MVIDELIERAQAASVSFNNGNLPAPPARRVAIVTCMDARIDVHAIFGLQPGDAHVIRNAGGAVTDDAIRSLAISQRLLGTEEIMVMHHTECGMMGFRGEDFARQLQDETGIRPGWAVETFTDVESDVRQSLARIHASPFLGRKDAVRGFVYDVRTGRVDEVRP